MKSNSVSLAVDEFAKGRADALILIGRILLAVGIRRKRVWSNIQLQRLCGLFQVPEPSST
ncbi:hypothetical protein ACVWXQ_008018 [Bradyrhizobium sp. S3.14.4]